MTLQRFQYKSWPGWERELSEKDGLVYWETVDDVRGPFSYWTPDGYYSVSPADCERLSRAAVTLNDMFIKAGEHVIEDHPELLTTMFGIPEWAVPAIQKSWQDDDPTAYWPSVYGRFDLSWSGRDGDDPKLLEYNADTPTGFPEATSVQWNWLQRMRRNGRLGSEAEQSKYGQWNNAYEDLVQAWRRNLDLYVMRSGRPVEVVHVAYTEAEKAGEDAINAAAHASAIEEAGYRAKLITMESIRVIGKDGELSFLTANDVAETGDFIDADGELIHVIFKLYPWEWMYNERFGKTAAWNMLHSPRRTIWVEPWYKVLFSHKAILAILWMLYHDKPEGRYLLPTYLMHERPEWLTHYVLKPMLGREGAGVRIILDGVVVEGEDTETHYDESGFIVQQYCPLPVFDTPSGPCRPLTVVWMIDNPTNPEEHEASGLGFRDAGGVWGSGDKQTITGNQSRFTLHIVPQ